MAPSDVLSGHHSMVDLLAEAAVGGGDRGFGFRGYDDQPERWMTFGTVDRRARAIAVALADLPPGSPVVLAYPAGPEFVTAFFGCLYAGMIAIPMASVLEGKATQSRARLHAVVADSGARRILCTAADRTQLLATGFAATLAPGVRLTSTDDADESSADAWRRPDIRPETVTHLQYSSGSTGQPKAVSLTHRAVLEQLGMLARAVGVGPETGIASWLPHFHDFGLVGAVLLPVYARTSVWSMAPMSFVRRPVRWLETISQHRTEMIMSPNFGFDLCASRATPESLAGLDLSGVRHALVGAEPVRADTLERFCATFGPAGFSRSALRPGYGLAEATLMVTLTSPGDLTVVDADAEELLAGRLRPPDEDTGQTRRLVSSGLAPAGVDVVIVDPATTQPVADGTVGEILVDSAANGAGYWNQPELTAEVFHVSVEQRPGRLYLRTGDLGVRSEGRLYVTGRIKDMIIFGGQNHYPHDIEVTVEGSHDGLRPGRSIAFSVDDGHAEQLVVVAEVAPGRWRNGDAEQRRRHLLDIETAVRAAVAAEHGLRVHRILLLQSRRIPTTSSGKRQRRQCRDLYLAGGLTE
ncbi:fatty acyl-AMP ligase [Micromonospora echinospora]|uniref:fatty acyl-AMP ligase n=1 Tax=Micromonospora echinospora TaxID=1877 RepID=UPI0037A0D8B8